MAKQPKKSKKNQKSTLRRLRLSLALALIIAVGLMGVYLAYTYRHQHVEAGQFKVSDTFLGENLSDSLDLKLAAKAAYPSAPIAITQSLGIDNGVQTKHFSFKVMNDNLTEYGLLLLPATPPPASGYPTIILLHGFSSPRDYLTDTYYVSDMEFYAQHGFAVFKPDYRGQGLSVANGHPNSAYYSMDYNTDVMSLISALKQTSLVDKAKLNIWGHSMGAYIGLRAAVLSKDIKNLILLSPPIDALSKMYVTYVPPSDSHNPYALESRNEVFSKYHAPNNDQFWKDASPINYPAQINAHIQIHVGLQDEVVPPEFAEDFNAALNRTKIHHDYFAYPDGLHSLEPQRDLIWSRSLQLLTR